METVYKNIHRDLIERGRLGDKDAQSELYRLYAKAMYNIAYRISNNQEDAEDILQESFVSAFENLDKYRGDASFGAWLKRIVVNRSINQIKKRKLEVELQEEGIEGSWEESNPYDDEELILNVDRIRRAIHLLPDGYRVVFSLYLLEGYDHKEVAQILNITESTSKSQYNRAKKKLKEILKERINETG